MSKGKTVQQSSAKVPKYQEDYYKKVYARSEAESNKPFVPFTGQGVADRNQAQTLGYNTAVSNVQKNNQYDPVAGMSGLLNQRVNVAGNNYNPNIQDTADFSGATANRSGVREVTPQMIMGTLGNYMNPYTQINIDQGVKDLNKARMQQLMSDQDQQIGQGAFGGSRGALLEAETNKNYNESVADFVDKKREDAFNVATNLANQDINRQLQADQFNAGVDQQFGLQDAQFSQQAGLQNQTFDQAQNMKLADLGLAQANMNQDVNMAQANLDADAIARNQGIFESILGQQNLGLSNLQREGLLQNQYDQDMLDYARRQFDLEQNQGLKNLGVLQSGLSGISPLISTTGSSQKKTGFGDILGAGLQVASLFPFPSDSRLKKAIKFLFKLPNGINIYSWEWNKKAEELNIPEEYPGYNVGVIAQEVMHIPNAVIQDENGFLKVNYEVL